jgi:hypothetical protein
MHYLINVNPKLIQNANKYNRAKTINNNLGNMLCQSLSYFSNNKVWINQVMDDHDLGYIVKLKKIQSPTPIE